MEFAFMVSFIIAFILTYTWGVLGISLGYHRGLSHRSFKLPRWLDYFFVIGGYLVFEGAPIFWVASHRLHHRYSDHEGDPHSPRDGLWHSMVGWMSKPVVVITEDQYKVICPDLFRDPFYKFLHAGGGGRDGYLCLAVNVVFRLALLAFFGPWALAGNVIASALAFLAPVWVNSICHLPQFGYQTYSNTNDLSRNVWFVALASFGEGWHNNHHAFPQSARHGLTPTEFDFSYSVLLLFKALGLARDIRLPKDKASTSLPPENTLERDGLKASVDDVPATMSPIVPKSATLQTPNMVSEEDAAAVQTQETTKEEQAVLSKR